MRDTTHIRIKVSRKLQLERLAAVLSRRQHSDVTASDTVGTAVDFYLSANPHIAREVEQVQP